MNAKQPVRECDLLVVGGGVNGTAIARDAAGRGLSVILCEQDDLAAHTSSASSKLIHGGLRYLEYYEFGLVRKALIEREVLLRAAPHIIRPLRIVMPHDRGQRPAWLLRLGFFLYDHLARRALLPGSHAIDLRRHPSGRDLQEQFVRGFVYSDATVDDARLVVLNAVDAAERGATIMTRTTCSDARREAGNWIATLRAADGSATTVQAKCMVNASGAWAAKFAGQATQHAPEQSLRLVKGSHIVVRKLFDHDHAYIFQSPDGRIVFAIPYEGEFTLIGTTDLEYKGDPARVAIDEQEVDYLCELANRYFRKRIAAADVVWAYSGVRPLLQDEAADAKAVTRDYKLVFDTDGAPLLSVFGGKITTARKLGEEAVDLIAPALGTARKAWTANACLPGGEIVGGGPSNEGVREFGAYVACLQRHYHWLPPALVARYAEAYGSRIDSLLAGCGDLAGMGSEILPGLYEIELRYLITREWARNAEDVLWRRTKLGLHVGPASVETLAEWMSSCTALTN
ncbi:MAG: glycerol-3-phosphate dehydrogenase [Telluria sp.]